MNKKVTLFKVLNDLFMLQSCVTLCSYLIIGGVSFCLSFYYCDGECFDYLLREYGDNVIPCMGILLGFTIAAYAFLFHLDKEKITMASEKAENGKSPYEVSCSTFSISILFQLVTLLSSFLYVLFHCSFFFRITISFTLLFIWTLFDITLNLFALRTVLKQPK